MESLLKHENLQPNFDINKYMGEWYEIARLPNPFDLDCANATARYRKIAPNTISIVNKCYNDKRKVKRKALGTGKVIYPKYPAALNVQFLGGEKYATNDPNYLVHRTDYYNTAVVGTHGREGLYFLSRTPHISYAKYEELKNYARALGYDVDKLVIDYKAVEDPLPLKPRETCKTCQRIH